MTPKKKGPGRPKASVKRDSIVNLKGVPEFKAWLDDFSDFVGLSLADTIGMSLQHFAEHKGFRPPPKR